MRVIRFHARSLVGAIAALGIAAALAGPALAGGGGGPPARTGAIHDDCEGVSLQESGGKLELRANCRTSDENEDKAQTSIDLSDIKAVPNHRVGILPNSERINPFPGLGWRESGWSRFYDACHSTELQKRSGGVWGIKTRCRIQICAADWGGRMTNCSDSETWGYFDLHSKYWVNSAGKLAIR